MSQNNTPVLADAVVLVVESQFPIALEMQTMMTDLGAARVILAANVRNARLELENAGRAQLVVLDVSRFDEDSQSFVEDIRRLGIALVVTTAEGMRPDIDAWRQAAILTKPYFDYEIRQAIETALRSAVAPPS